MSSRGLGCEEKIVFRTLELTATPTSLATEVNVGQAWSITQCPIASTRESAPTNSQVMAITRGQIADFRYSFERIKWQYLLFACGIKTCTQFELVLWHWFSPCQLKLKPTGLNDLVGCKVPNDEAMHIGFYYNTQCIIHYNSIHTHQFRTPLYLIEWNFRLIIF